MDNGRFVGSHSGASNPGGFRAPPLYRSKLRAFPASIALSLVMLALWLAAARSAYAIDVDPGDYETPVPGHPILLLYAQHVERSRIYVDGNAAATNARLSSDIGLLRYGVPIQTSAGVFLPQFILPFGRLKSDGNLSGLGDAHGTGDLLLAAPLWPITDRDGRKHFGISPYLFLPTGSYDKNRGLNLGENRWKFDLQVGSVTPLGNQFSLDLALDAMVYGSNKEFGRASQVMRQDVTYQLQGTINYLYTDATRFAIGLSHKTGGRTRIDGAAQNDKTKTTKVLLSASTFISPTNQLLLSYGQDLSVLNGLKEDTRFNFRLLHVF